MKFNLVTFGIDKKALYYIEEKSYQNEIVSIRFEHKEDAEKAIKVLNSAISIIVH